MSSTARASKLSFHLLQRLVSALVVAFLLVIPAVIAGAPAGHRIIVKQFERTRFIAGAEAKEYIAKQHALNADARMKWEKGVASIEGRGRH